jgi:hypothetical protein
MSYPECTFNDGDPPLGQACLRSHLFDSAFIAFWLMEKAWLHPWWVDMNGDTGVKVAWLTELRLSVIIQMHCTSEKSRIFAFNINIIDPKPP